MIFSELYSAYYNTVAKVLSAAVDHPLKKSELRELIAQNAFGESILNIMPAIEEQRWQLICSDGSTPIRHRPTMPLTLIEKRWLKAIFSDPRIKLFTDDIPDIPDVEPLFKPEDISVFDSYSDGDDYHDEKYIRNFRLILDAIKNRYPLSIDVTNRKGTETHMELMPEHLEYSEKDDKFRLIGSGCRYGGTVNLGRIIRCKPSKIAADAVAPYVQNVQNDSMTVEFVLYDLRNALERVLMHFAHFKKQAEKIGEDRYLVKISYDKSDETEMVIRILSFGPMVKVISPDHFVELIKKRLTMQKSCGH